jgi:hypothetical protein
MRHFATTFLSAALALSTAASAQQLLRDDFAYAGPLTSNGWFAHSSGGQRTIVSFGDYAILSQGTGAGEDLSRGFPQLAATDSVYAAFRLNVPSGNAVNPASAGLYFIHFKDGTTGFRARTGVLAPASGGAFRLAIHADSANLGLGAAWPSDLAFDTDYLVVIGFDGALNRATLWVDPITAASPSIGHTGTLPTPFVTAIALRQSSEYTGSLRIDNLIVGRTFVDVAGAGRSYVTFGAGCSGSVGVPSNTASPLPRLGRTTTITIGNVTVPAIALLLVGTSNTFSPSFGPLPIDLTAFGAPGCSGRVSDDVTQFFALGFAGVPFDVAIPNDTYFMGLQLYTQALVFENVNPLGLVLSDAATFVIGG